MSLSSSMDTRFALNAAIKACGVTTDEPRTITNTNANTPPTATAPKKAYKGSTTTEWNVASETGTFQGEHWPSHLPRPPSRKKLLVDDKQQQQRGGGSNTSTTTSNTPSVVVFNANTQEGSSLVRVLSEKGLRVTAVVRVFTSKNTKNLIKLKNVIVKVADLNNFDAVTQAATNCQQAFLVTKYWERFENTIEESMAKVVLNASATAGIQRLILATFENTMDLRMRHTKSQLIPTIDGRIFPKFTGMEGIHILSKRVGVSITHMFTSYLEDAMTGSKKSIILIRGENGKIMLQEHNNTTN